MWLQGVGVSSKNSTLPALKRVSFLIKLGAIHKLKVLMEGLCAYYTNLGINNTMIECTFCGHSNDPNAFLCRKCSKRLDEISLVSNYKVGRIILVFIAATAWIFVLSAIAVLIAPVGFFPDIIGVSLLIGGLLIILGVHAARAIFDISDNTKKLILVLERLKL